MSTSTTIRRNSNHQNRNFRNFMWISMLMSLAVVFFGMQLMMIGPLKGRLDGIQARLDASDHDMQQLVGAQDSVLETNSLLHHLEEQSGELVHVRATIDEIAALRTRLKSEASSATAALTELDRLSAVQQRLIGSREEMDSAMLQIARLESLRDDIIRGSGKTEVADNSLDGMLALQQRVIAASNGYEKASSSIANLVDLTQRLVESDADLQIAAERFDSFIGLQNRVIAAADNFETADNSLRTLVAMKDTLNGESLNLQAAGRNLDQLVVLQGKLGNQTVRVAEAIEHLELMDDFQTEVAAHIHALGSLRRTLLELAMMESTVGRVAQVIAPLTDISNLRRLSESDVRAAARAVLQQRNTRLSHSDDAGADSARTATGPTSPTESANTDLVPLPPEARRLQ